MSIFPILFSWRLTVILPSFYNLDILESMKVNMHRQGGDSQFVLMNLDISAKVNDDYDDDSSDGSENERNNYEEEDSNNFEEDEIEIQFGNESLNDMLATFHGDKA